ncbi:flavin-containing monooxygenase [Melittangium boletus]|uniref:Pyridine nucleotide-disulfide oxidoreductase n=1 Tax=Melittangium boletus DSM 14713 TaxID=1294270 RepID=A0A250IL12_9BACT|nr:NAD(P)/FAD-dependent oxidoreductase [Melittangium boletus]ATB32445.1 pyridine nucleotide-disulfide oxidoreductase [Melittangium boletus DSM 14713]
MTSTTQAHSTHRSNVLIIGGGQSGLALGYYLARRGQQFTILDGGSEIGHMWRNRWESLQLITPCPYNNLPGMDFEGPAWSFPHKDQVADYLVRYAKKFSIPVQTNHKVSSLRRVGENYQAETNQGVFEAPVVVLATGPYHEPRIPDAARGADERVVQMHSKDYRSSKQMPAGEDVLVVGCGNSGAGIAQDLARTHKVHLALGRTAWLRRRILGRDLFWWAHLLGLPRVTADSRLGSRMKHQPDEVIGTTPERLAAEHGIKLQSRVVAVDGNEVRFADGTQHRFGAIVWATGYRPSYPWVHVPVFTEEGAPQHQRGVTSSPGLYFLGLKWLYYFDSSLLGGVGRDAAFIDQEIASYLSTRAPNKVAHSAAIP